MKHKKKRSMQLLYAHISNNIKEYFSVIVVLLIGIVLGVIAINNSSDDTKVEIQTYINDFISSVSENENIDKLALAKSVFTNNLFFIIMLIFIGSTVIGIPIVYAIVAYKGFCLSYTIAAIIAVLGSKKGFIFALASVFLQNLIYIPCILALAVSGIRLYKSIVKDKRKENIKLEILRHVIFSLLVGAILLLGTLVESYISTNLLILCATHI